MASATRPRIRGIRPSKATISKATVLQSANSYKTSNDARRELLADLMSDAKKYLATKSKTERKAVALAIKEIANG